MIWIYGIFTIVAQSALLRDVSALFQSNEITVSVLFFYWLLGTGLGSYFFKRFKLETSKAFIITNICFVLCIFLAKVIFGFLQYRANPDIFLLFILSALLILPVSFCTGYCFASFYNDKIKLWRLYAIESLAAFLGGLIFTFGVAGNLEPMTTSLISLCVSLLLIRTGKGKYKKLLYVSAALLVAILAPTIRHSVDSIQWRKNTKLVSTRESRYANVTLVENSGISSLYYGGKIISSYPAQALYEEIVHVPLMAKALKPENILIVGYAPREMLDEFYRYQPLRVDVVTQDKKLSSIAKDPFSWIKNSTQKFDVVLLNVSTPSTISEARFFTDTFFASVSRALDKNGILVAPVSYEENAPLPATKEMLKIIYNTLKSSFQYVQIIPGSQFYFIASNDDTPLITSKKLPEGVKFINKGYVDHYLSQNRIDEFNKMLLDVKTQKVNSLNSMRLFNLSLMKWVKNYSSFSLLLVIAAFAFFFVKLGTMLKTATARSRTLFVCGIVSIVAEIALLTLFQINTGQIYYLYGLFVASFMLGLGIGATLKKIPPFYIAVWPVIVLVASIFTFIPIYVFIILNMFGGMISGGVFYFLAAKEDVEQMDLYSFDLLGSAFGALITGPLLLPVLGVTATLGIVILLAGIACRKYI